MDRSGLHVLSPTVYDRSLPLKDLPEGNTDCWIGRWPAIPYLRVCWHVASRLDVLLHCCSTPDVEVGGVLVGQVFRTAGAGGPEGLPLDYIEISGAIRAQSPDAGVGHITLTPDTWARINVIRDRDFPDQQIVGWYHSHPGHSVFLSEQDRFVHNNFFAQDFQLALVVDTYEHYGAFFVDSAQQGGPYRSIDFRWDHNFMLWVMQVAAAPVAPTNPVPATPQGPAGQLAPGPARAADPPLNARQPAARARTSDHESISISMEELPPEERRGVLAGQTAYLEPLPDAQLVRRYVSPSGPAQPPPAGTLPEARLRPAVAGDEVPAQPRGPAFEPRESEGMSAGQALLTLLVLSLALAVLVGFLLLTWVAPLLAGFDPTGIIVLIALVAALAGLLFAGLVYWLWLRRRGRDGRDNEPS